MTIRVLIADDHTVVREGLRLFLSVQDDIEVVGEAVDGREAIEQAEALQPDVLLLDMVMPEMDGLTALPRIRQVAPQTAVLVLTSFGDDRKVIPAVRAGAAGYLLKSVSSAELVEAVRQVAAGKPALHPDAARMLMREVRSGPGQVGNESFTPRELEVLSLLAHHLSNKEIAAELGIGEKTVKTHVSNILSKLGVRSRADAARYAREQGLGSR